MILGQEKAWKLGADVHQKDNILDGITFEDIIDSVRCSLPADQQTPTKIRRLVNEVIEQRMQDFRFLLDNNIHEIIAQARN
jgi:hypothetical protein